MFWAFADLVEASYENAFTTLELQLIDLHSSDDCGSKL